jgi:methyltransferase (TIGR00027 family)
MSNRVAAGRPSRTAMMVAYWRVLADQGLTTVPGFSDPFARKLLQGSWWRWMLARADSSFAKPKWREGMLPAVDGITMRVAFLDSWMLEAQNPQVVILGAGLDTRAWRFPALRDAHVFEVDHPSTQAYKREHAAALGPPAGPHSWVGVDFDRDDLWTALASAGHDPARATTWIWEGVTMYLDDDAVRGTLEKVRAASAAGSVLLAHYHEPEARRQRSLLRTVMFRMLGEPQIGLRTRAQMQALVTAAGFDVVEDAGIDEQAARVGGKTSSFPMARVSRIAVARPR